MGIFLKEDKVAGLEDAAAMVNDGDIIAVGGGGCLREPIAFIRELIRQGKRNLHAIGTAHGFDVDLMCGGGILGSVRYTHVSFESDFGLAPNYRSACESGQIQVLEDCCVNLMHELRAAAFGLPFIPVRNMKGSDILKFHPEFKQIACPYTGETLTLLPPLIPDVAVIHAQYADAMGHAKITQPFVSDTLFVDAAKKVIITCEKLVSTEKIKELIPNIPYFEVTAVVEVPYGAHPTSCYPFYAYDRQHISEYMESARKGIDQFRNEYLGKYVLGTNSHQQYLDLVGGQEKLRRLESWKESTEKWMESYRYE